ncbi:MAG: rod shape-determining protein MreD [Pseudohongiellaceae bacterium]
MEPKANGVWVIILSLLIAYLLAIVPFPDWALHYRPQWVAIVLIYWAMALPYRIGIGVAWMAGLFLDVLEGSLLGLNAMSLAIVVYITLSLHQRLRMFSFLQQSALVLALVGLHMLLVYWVRVAFDQSESRSLLFLLGALSSAFIWPWIFVFLRRLRRAFNVH